VVLQGRSLTSGSEQEQRCRQDRPEDQHEFGTATEQDGSPPPTFAELRRGQQSAGDQPRADNRSNNQRGKYPVDRRSYGTGADAGHDHAARAVPGRDVDHLPVTPTLEGQYIIKNVVLVAAAIVLGATVRGGELVPEPVLKSVREYRP
jgi:hypothetical protein